MAVDTYILSRLKYNQLIHIYARRSPTVQQSLHSPIPLQLAGGDADLFPETHWTHIGSGRTMGLDAHWVSNGVNSRKLTLGIFPTTSGWRLLFGDSLPTSTKTSSCSVKILTPPITMRNEHLTCQYHANECGFQPTKSFARAQADSIHGFFFRGQRSCSHEKTLFLPRYVFIVKQKSGSVEQL